jgi:hypothetical protein
MPTFAPTSTGALAWRCHCRRWLSVRRNTRRAAHNHSSTTLVPRATTDDLATTARDRAPTAVVVAAVAVLVVALITGDAGGDAIAIATGPATIRPDTATAALASPASTTPAATSDCSLRYARSQVTKRVMPSSIETLGA